MTPQPLSDEELATLQKEVASHGGTVSELRLLATVQAQSAALRKLREALVDASSHTGGPVRKHIDDVLSEGR